MATEVKRRRGTTAQHLDFIGAEAEITVDIDKYTLLVHDDSGTKPTGHELLRADFSNIPASVTADVTIVGEVDATKFSGDLTGAIHVQGKNDSGGTLTKGTPVYISGQVGAGQQFTIAVADADDSAKMPCIGILAADVNNNAQGDIVTHGKLIGIDTSSFTVGDELYISDSGTLTATPPTGESNLLQKIAKVIRVDSSDGQIYIMGAGRTNAVPNLNQDKIFLGDSNNQAVATALSSIGLTSFNDDSTFLKDADFGSDGLMKRNSEGVYTNITDSSSNWDAAYTYSQVGHLPLTGGTISQNLTISGNLTVSGTTTTVNTETINLADNIITLNSNFTGNNPTENAGIEIERGDLTNKSFFWNEATDQWNADSALVATSFIKQSNTGGFLKADGTEDTSTYLTTVTEAAVLAHADDYDHWTVTVGLTSQDISSGDALTLTAGDNVTLEIDGANVTINSSLPAGAIDTISTSNTSGLSSSESSGDVTLNLALGNLTEATTADASADSVAILEGANTKKILLSNLPLISDDDFSSNGLMKRTGAGTYGIVTDNSSNWDTAYGWGDHSTEGYLTAHPTISGNATNQSNSGTTVIQSLTFDSNGHVLSVGSTTLSQVTDTNDYIASVSFDTSAFTFSADYNTGSSIPSIQSVSWSHNHDGRYYTETEVGNFFSGTTSISGYNKSNWDTAFGWGNHATAGYLTAVPSEFLTQTEGDARYLELSGGTLTGSLTVQSVSAISTAAPKFQLIESDTTDENKEILLSGGDFFIRNLNDDGTVPSNENILKISHEGVVTLLAQGTTTATNLNALFQDGNGVLKRRTLGSNAFNSTAFLTSSSFTVADDDTNTTDVATNGSLTISGGTGIDVAVTTGTVTITSTVTDTDTNTFVNAASFNTGDGVLTLTKNNSSTVTADLDGRYLQLSGGTITSGSSIGLIINHNNFAQALVIHRNHSANAPAITFKNNTGQAGILYATQADGALRWRPSTTTEVNKVFHDGYHPNADTLTTARTITLGGDLTGSASFDGSADITISAQVSNNSHTHDDRYLQLTGGTLTDSLIINVGSPQLILRDSTDDDDQSILFRTNGDVDLYSITGNNDVLNIKTLTSRAMKFFTNDTLAMTIDTDGSIDTEQGLDVGGTLKLESVAQDTASTSALVWAFDGSETVKYRTLGSNAFNSTTIPTNNNQLTNGAGYITSFDITTQTDPKYLRSDVEDQGHMINLGGEISSGSAAKLQVYGFQRTGPIMIAVGNTSSTSWGTSNELWLMNSAGSLYVGDGTNYTSKVWHSTNDGTGSGLDADLLDGQHASAFLTSVPSALSANSLNLNSFDNDEGTEYTWFDSNSSSAGSTWYKVANIVLGSGSFSGITLEVEYYYPNTNHGSSADVQRYFGFVRCTRSSGSDGNINDAEVQFFDANRIRVAKTDLGEYELQARANVNNRSYGVTYRILSSAGATVTPATTKVAGNTDAGTVFYSGSSDDGAQYKFGGTVKVGSDLEVTGDLDVDGNVGIGTSLPSAKLEVDGTGTLFQVNSASSREFYIDTTNPDHLKKNQNLVLSADPSNVHASTKMLFRIDNDDKLTILNNGNVGIGTISPSSSFRLDVNGAGRFVNDLYADEDLVVADNIYLSDTNTKLTEGSGDALRIETTTGYVDIGSQNSSYLHLQTDRDRFYFNKQLVINTGIVESYDEDLQLRRAESTNDRITIKDASIDFDLDGTTEFQITTSEVIAKQTMRLESVNEDTNATTALLYSQGQTIVRRTLGSNAFNSTTIPTNNNQLTNGAGYITSFDITTQTDPKYLRSNASDTTTGNITIGKADPILILNDTSTNNTTNLQSFITFKAQGTEKGYVGFGSGSNDYLYLVNNNGRIDIQGSTGVFINSDTDISGDLEVDGNITANDGTRGIMMFMDASGAGDRAGIIFDIDSADGIGSGSDYLMIVQDGINEAVIQTASAGNGDLRFKKGTADLMMLKGSGNVGIGTISPNCGLFIDGNSNNSFARARFSYNGTTRYSQVGHNTSGGFLELVRETDGASNTLLRAYGASYLNAIAGNVGIGTTSPSSFANYKNLSIKGGSSGVNLDFHNSSGTRVAAIVSNPSTTFIVETNEAAPIVLKTNDTERMRIGSGGNVGIGTSSNLHSNALRTTLSLNGSSSASYALGVSGTLKGFLYSDNSLMALQHTSGDILLEAGGSEKMRIDSSGDVLVKTIDARIGSDVGAVEYGTSTNNSVRFYQNNQERMRLDGGTGNVGIGTTSPVSPLTIGDYIGTHHVNSATLPNTPSNHLLNLTPPSTTNYYGGGISWSEGTKTAASINTVDAGSGGALHLTFATGNNSSLSERMRIDTSGNVGIGTTSPSGKLDVVGGGGNTSPTLELNSSTSTTFNHAINAFNSNLTSGENQLIVVGKAGSTKNSGYIGYKWNGTGNNTNLLTFGHWGNDNLMNLNGGGSLGLGTQSPAEKLHVEGSVLIDAANLGAETGIFFREGFSQSNKYNISILAYDHNGSFPDGLSINAYDGISFNTGSNNRNERMRIALNGNVGIGTTDPKELLHIYQQGVSGNYYDEGALQIGGTTNSLGALLTYHAQNSGRTSLTNLNNAGGADATVSIGFGTINTSGRPTKEVLTVTQAGNVGIGTTSPTSAGGYTKTLQVSDANSASISVSRTSSVTSSIEIGTFSGSNLIDSIGSGIPLRFKVDGSERMRIDSNGQVYFKSSTDYKIGLNDSAGTNQWWLKSYTNGDFAIHENGVGDKFTIQASGNVGIGNTSPSGKLQIDNVSGNTLVLRKGTGTPAIAFGGASSNEAVALLEGISGGGFKFYTGSGTLASPTWSPRMVLNSSGNVGIGNTDPAQKLVVNGGVHAYGNITTPASGTYGLLMDFYIANSRFWSRGTTGGGTRGGFAFYQLEADGTNQITSFALDTSGNATFGYDVDISNDLIVDGNVGIGTANPSEKLDVVGNVKSQYNGNNYSRLGQTSSGGYIQAYSGAVEKVMFRSYGASFINGGNVGIGTDSPISKLHVVDSQNIAANGSGDGQLSVGGSGYTFAVALDAQAAHIYHNSSVRNIEIGTNEGTDLTIHSNGNVSIADGNLIVAAGHGVDFSANQNSGGMTSELLDDYEEGTFTPTIHAGASNITLASNNYGKYTKVGNVVHCSGRFQASSLTAGSSSTNVELGGLPFTCDAPLSTGTGAVAGSIGFAGGFAGEVATMMQIRDGENNAFLYYQNASLTTSNVKGNDLGNTTTIVFQITYQTAS